MNLSKAYLPLVIEQYESYRRILVLRGLIEEVNGPDNAGRHIRLLSCDGTNSNLTHDRLDDLSWGVNGVDDLRVCGSTKVIVIACADGTNKKVARLNVTALEGSCVGDVLHLSILGWRGWGDPF